MGSALVGTVLVLGFSLTLIGQLRELSGRWAPVTIVGLLTVAFAFACAYNEYEVDDKYVYSKIFQEVARVPDARDFPLNFDWAFSVALWIFARIFGTSDASLFGSVSLVISVGFLFCAFKYMSAWAVPGAFVTALSTGILYSYSVVAIRQGLSMALFLIAIGLIASHGRARRRKLTVVVLLVAALMHWSAALPAALIGLHLIRPVRVRHAVTFWLLMAGLFVTGLQERLFNPLLLRSGVALDLMSTSAYSNYGSTGNRIDFLIVSAVIALMGFVALRATGQDSDMESMLVCYLLLNSMFLAFGFVAYADRIASYSWMLAPIMLWTWCSRMRNSAAPAATYSVAAIVGLTATSGLSMLV